MSVPVPVPGRLENPDPTARAVSARHRADFRQRPLRGQSWGEVDRQGADLRAVDLRGADLFGCRMRPTDLRGAFLETTRIVETWVSRDLDLEIIDQIRAFDFRWASRRHVRSMPGRAQSCPYRDATLRPVLYEWGSRTWNGGKGWVTPSELWTLEEIIAATLSALECRHDLPLPSRRLPYRTARPVGSDVTFGATAKFERRRSRPPDLVRLR